MKNYRPILILLFTLISFSSFGQGDDLYGNHKQNSKTAKRQVDTIEKDKYKLTQKEFMAIYGIDDTSRALIKYFFQKRGVGYSVSSIYGVSTFMQLFFLHALIDDSKNKEPGWITTIALLYTFCIHLPVQFLLIAAAENFSVYSKKNLYIVLINYLQGKGIAQKHYKNLTKSSYYFRH